MLLLFGLLVVLVVGGIRVLVSSLIVLGIVTVPFLIFLLLIRVGIGGIVLISRFLIGRWSETACASCNTNGSSRENEFMIHFEEKIRNFMVRFPSMDENLAARILLDRTNEEVEYHVGDQSGASLVSVKESLFASAYKVVRIVTFVLQVSKLPIIISSHPLMIEKSR